MVLALLAAACTSADDAPGGEAGETATRTPVSTASEPATTTSPPAPDEPATTASTGVGWTVTTVTSATITTTATTVTSAAEADPEENAVDPVDEAGTLDGRPAIPERAIRWIGCDVEGLECGVVTVPLDYRDPGTGDLALTIAVHRATDPDRRIGYLMVNPGGSGGSGVDMVAWALDGPGAAFTAPLLERFDIVGFDPRGAWGARSHCSCAASPERS